MSIMYKILIANTRDKITQVQMFSKPRNDEMQTRARHWLTLKDVAFVECWETDNNVDFEHAWTAEHQDCVKFVDAEHESEETT